MSRSSDRAQRGYMLMEVVVSLLALVLILVLSAQLLFATRRASVRQQLHVEARQVARGAADFLAFQLRGATDRVTDLTGGLTGRNPFSVVAWVWQGANPGAGTTFPVCGPSVDNDCKQKSFNNVTDANLADVGTDIITIAHSDHMYRSGPLQWADPELEDATIYWRFDIGCTPTSVSTWADDDATNFRLFREYTGQTASPCPPGTAGGGCSEPLIVVNSAGQVQMIQVIDYHLADNADTCAATVANLTAPCRDNSRDSEVVQGPCMAVTTAPFADTPNLPGGPLTLAEPVRLLVGVRFVSYRVCRGWLEQKTGMFDAATDANCAGAGWDQGAWTPLLDNVEDLQVAYLYTSGVWANASVASRLTTTGAVPVQGDLANAADVSRLVGFRVTVTARSSTEVIGEGKRRNLRPAAEDNVAGTTDDLFYYYQVSAAAMLRNRAPQN